MSDNYLAVQALGFTTGSALFAMLTALAWRSERRGGGPRRGTRAAALAFLWNVGSLVQYTALLSGLGPASLVCRVAAAAAWCALALAPTAVLMLLQPAAWARRWQAHASRWFRRLSYAIAALLTLGFIGAASSPGLRIEVSALGGPLVIGFHLVMRLSAYNLVLHVLAGALLTPGAATLNPVGRAYSRTMLLWMVGLGLLLMINLHFGFSPAAEFALETLAQQSTIPVAIFSLVYLGRFSFADVFAKRSLVILAAVVIALTFTLLVAGPVLRGISPRRPEPSAWLAATVLWAALLLVFPALERAINGAADRRLFRRPDYRALAEEFSRDSDTVRDEPELFALAEQAISAAIDVSSVQVLPADPELAHESDTATREDRVPPGLPRRSSAAEVRVSIPVNGTAGYVIVALPPARGRKLLSDELRFLSSLADRLGRRIESLRFECELRQRELHTARLRHLLAEAELKALRAQLNPHFLFNTLNTILDLIGSEPEKAEAMIERLSDLFRHVLVRTERDLISVGEEIDFLRKYLEIERARFGARLSVSMDVDPVLLGELIPPLILQPLVENAIKHGLAPKLGAGAIRISAADAGDSILFTVEDNGVGWPSGAGSPWVAAEFMPGEQVGLRNVRERLETIYGDQAALTISTSPGTGASVCISLLKRDAENSDSRRRRLRQVTAAETPGRP